MKIADIAHQVTAMYEREVAIFNESKLTKLERRAAIPERTPFWKRMLLSLGNTMKGERVTPANMWKYLKYHVEEARSNGGPDLNVVREEDLGRTLPTLLNRPDIAHILVWIYHTMFTFLLRAQPHDPRRVLTGAGGRVGHAARRLRWADMDDVA
jgi:hypothetical protein